MFARKSRARPEGRNARMGHDRPVRVLLIEDHEDMRESLELLLQSEGYEVVVARDGDEGLASYRRSPADVVLVDIFMPGKNGVVTIEELRRDSPEATVIAMSGDGGGSRSGALARAVHAGAHLTLRKPLEPWILLRTLEGALAARWRRRAVPDQASR